MQNVNEPICIIANPKSGRNRAAREALESALSRFGPNAFLEICSPKTGFSKTINAARKKGVRRFIAAGGDGTIMAVASSLVNTNCSLGVLPLGTFNYFSRGLGLPEDVAGAADTLKQSSEHLISVGTVNGNVFLNNASLGVYPSILKERETVYKRWGRKRIAAHWSVIKTFLRFQRPMRIVVAADGVEQAYRTPLVFVARSEYQLNYFGLEGVDAIKSDGFAVFIARDGGRADLFRLAWRLVTRQMKSGVDFDLVRAKEITITTRIPMALVACDGEKLRLKSPLRFEMKTNALRIIMPK